jgi:hypothetical protein
MNITEKEVERIDIVGKLNGEDVKLVKTFGGLFLAVGKKSKNGKKDQPLAAGSHQGIVLHQIEKEFGHDFHQKMHKNESDISETIENKTDYLPNDLISKGIELYTVIKKSNIDFVVYRHGLTIGEYNTSIKKNELHIDSFSFKKNYFNINSPETAKALAKVMQDKVVELGLDGVVKK